MYFKKKKTTSSPWACVIIRNNTYWDLGKDRSLDFVVHNCVCGR